jgi:thermostable 8-oxoguanine DNA glycosylase
MKELFFDNKDKVIFTGEKIKGINERWTLTKRDIEEAEKTYKKERIKPLNKEEMFKGALFCILSIGETSKKQKKLFAILQQEKLNTPERIINQQEKLKEIFGGNYKAKHPQRIFKFIIEFSSWWEKSNLIQEVIDDIKFHGGQRGIEFRDRLAGRKSADKASGMGPKVASYFMALCGYKNVVILDHHMFIFCEDNSIYPKKIPDSKHGGLWLSRYKKFEKRISEIAKGVGLTPAMFHLALWTKYSSVNKNN